jgi:hypothetical protein
LSFIGRDLKQTFFYFSTAQPCGSYDATSRRHFLHLPAGAVSLFLTGRRFRAFRAMAGLLSSVAEMVVSDVGSIDTGTDIQQANGFLLAQESPAVCAGGG